jgi:hypothetical protein
VIIKIQQFRVGAAEWGRKTALSGASLTFRRFNLLSPGGGINIHKGEKKC